MPRSVRDDARPFRQRSVFLPRSGAVLSSLAVAVACGSGDTRPAPPTEIVAPDSGADGSNAGSGGSTHAGGAGGKSGSGGSSASGGRGGDAATAPPDANGGRDAEAEASTAEPEAGVCGDGVIGPHEFCDGTNLNDADCYIFGYSGGVLRCDSSCEFDFSKCTGTELCFNGADDDGDGLIDCADPDCKTACAATCSTVTQILDPGHVNGSTIGHASEIASSCLPPGATSGPEVVYRVKAAVTGVLAATVSSTGADFSLSVRKDCADASTEIACRDLSAGAGATESVRVPVTRGDELFLVVDGANTDQAGIFVLDLASRPIVCGDGNLDPGEQCDDHNTASGDGCSSACKLELDEVEPNDTTSNATPYTELPFVAQISPVGDVDVFSIAVSAQNSMLAVDTLDLGDGACANMELDDRIDILAPDGHVLVSNDDGGVGFCAKASVSGLSPGTYYVRVKASGVATTFPYNLDISRSP